MAQTLQFEVVAEGIETAAQRDFLIESGCHDYQGNLFARPLREFEKFSFGRKPASLSSTF